jgi:hypothetical protein
MRYHAFEANELPLYQGVEFNMHNAHGYEDTSELETFLVSIGMAHLWPLMKSRGFSRVAELAKKATLDDLKMMVGRDATKLHFELEK